jgi:hypothetical protein
MKPLAILIAFLLLYTICQVAALAPQNVGGDFGKSWLQQHGTQPNVAQNTTALWNWGNLPKGYAIYNGQLIPPGAGPVWYYPGAFINNNTPIITNSTALARTGTDPWTLAELTGQPVVMLDTSAGPLF